ncbi:MAG: ATP-binding protein [Pseudomonadales bacterium]|jgi:two-component system phosphate regulon sensor histidine kinase PhoR|tara:strand:+ start:1238 stop:3016 length:1779 start_codon:yes stop_codon:yes gene_type:complete
MRHSPIFLRLYAGFAVVILFSILIVGLMVQRQIEQASLRDISNNLSSQAFILQQSFANTGQQTQSQIQQTLKQIGQRTDTRVTLLTKDGVVIADSEFNASEMDNHRYRPEIIAANTADIGQSRRYSKTLQKPMLYVAVSAMASSGNLGYIRTALPTQRIDEEINYLRRVIIIAASLTALIALFIGYWLAMSFARPLRQMTLIAKNYAHGRYQLRIPSQRRDEIGDLARSLNQMADISSQRFDIIKTERDQLSTILKSMNEGVITVTSEGLITHVNAAACRMLRTSGERCLGQALKDIDGSDNLDQAFRQCQQQQTSVERTIQLDGYTFSRHYRLHVTLLKQSHRADAILVLQDITAVQRIDKMRADFVANASHELKTPITAIRGFAETLIEDDTIDHAIQQRFMRKIHGQSIRLSALVSDLLALSRLESNDEAYNTQVDLQRVVQRVCANLQAVAQTQQVTLELQTKDGPVTLLGDDNALGQMATNLIDNAIKYTAAKGTVTVALTVTEGLAVLAVKDNGLGIDESDQERIFERFYRVDKARSQSLGGTGLGLAIVKHIVQSHKGRLQLKSKLNQGSTFTITIPLSTHTSKL